MNKNRVETPAALIHKSNKFDKRKKFYIWKQQIKLELFTLMLIMKTILLKIPSQVLSGELIY